MGDLDLQRWAIDAIGDLYGRHEGARATHAKGTLCAATVTATSAAAQLSRAGHLRGIIHKAHR